MDLAVMLGVFGVGFLVGAFLFYFASRGRVVAQVEAAVASATASREAELSQLRERNRSIEEARRSDHENHATLKAQAECWRDSLDTARDEVAKLGERAARIAVLENEVGSLGEQLRKGAIELLKASNEAAEKSQAVVLLSAQVNALEQEIIQLTKKLEDTANALNSVNERKASLEEQAARVPILEREVAETQRHFTETTESLSSLRETSGSEISSLAAQVSAEREAHTLVRDELTQTRRGRDAAEAEGARLNAEMADLRARLDSERESGAAKLELLLEAKTALSDQFKSLANDILEEKSKRFAEQNQATLGQLLDPLKIQLTEFKGKVEEVYVQEGKDRSALSEQVRHLVTLNQALSQDAKNLTQALKGNAKAQGNWGELVLERVLEASGLRKGYEYHVQDSQVREDGTRAQPDVIINLPEDRRLVVDAKVSLIAYEEHVVAETEDDRALAIRRHLDSVRAHIKGLSAKEYQLLYELKSLDFVLMFVPIEPAFMLAVTHDGELFMDAWNRNVLLVSPSTLLFVVRTVAHLWRQEAQSRNAQDIARRGAELYDKLCEFVKDLEGVGSRLKQAQDAYDSAHKRLKTGKGNVIRQAEMLRELGVKPTKALPTSLADASTVSGELDAVGELAALATIDTPLLLPAVGEISDGGE
jgi:DNA recombination protein RmuC